ncbi:MAG: hypothetical protein ACE1ZA_11115, partial [Pseudomonadales bacterium]
TPALGILGQGDGEQPRTQLREFVVVRVDCCGFCEPFGGRAQVPATPFDQTHEMESTRMVLSGEKTSEKTSGGWVILALKRRVSARDYLIDAHLVALKLHARGSS